VVGLCNSEVLTAKTAQKDTRLEEGNVETRIISSNMLEGPAAVVPSQ
jgi:hypothetical protein